MDKLLEKIKTLVAEKKLSKDQGNTLSQFFLSYAAAAEKNGRSVDAYFKYLDTLLDLVSGSIAKRFAFEPYHEAIRAPFDYYRFGLEFIRPLIAFERSTVKSTENIKAIEEQVSRGENVILFANHQTEPDPQIISIMLEKEHAGLAEKMIFIAGHRVITDPLAIPFSMGRNLLCIFSKKYIDNPIEEKEAKLLHNKMTMRIMGNLLEEGGKCIYVAPSGGRDRINMENTIEVAPFDPQSIELFRLIAKKAGPKVHFYPLALYTYDVLPPPDNAHKKISEQRKAQSSPVHLSFGDEIAMDKFEVEGMDRQQVRNVRAEYIWNLVKEDHDKLLAL